MNTAVFAANNPLQVQLPWESSAADDRRFRNILLWALGFFVVFAVALPLLPLDEVMREVRKEQPAPLARILLEPQVLPEPEPVVAPSPAPSPKPKSRPKPKPVEAKPVKAKPVKAKPVKAKPKEVKPAPKPIDKVKQAQEAAAAAGLLAFKDDLQAMRDTVDVEALNRTQTRRGQANAEKLQRAVIASNVAADSGGIATAALSTDTGGQALSGSKTTSVKSRLAGAGNGAGTRKAVAGDSAQVLGGRSDEAIRRVMDSQKGAIFAIYNRALRNDPLLEGKLVFEMVVEPDGSVSGVKLLSSELGSEALTRKILARIKLIRFGAAQVLSTRVNYSFDFLPFG